MSGVTVAIKRVRNDSHHVTYSDGGIEGRSLRLVIRGKRPPDSPSTTESLLAALYSMPDDASVHVAYDALVEGCIFNHTGRILPGAAAVLIRVAELVARASKQRSPEEASTLVRWFNKATSKLFVGNEPAMPELVRMLQAVEQAAERVQPAKEDA